MEINRRFSDNVRAQIRQAIKDADGNEVFFAGTVNEQGIVISVTPGARGSINSVPVNFSSARTAGVLIHNHPSGNIHPSDADLAVASDYSQQGQGFYIINNDVSEVYVVMECVLPTVIKKLDVEKTGFLLSKEGPFAQKSPDYEERPVQIELVKKIASAFNENKIGVFEAGTGVGKSFAYLIPSMLWASQNKERIVVSTGTINLQQQIIEKDIPSAEKITGVKLKALLVKGRQNYVCLRRLEETGKERDLFNDEQDVFDKIYEWARTTKTGSKSDLSFMPNESVWSKINSEADACMGSRCPHRENCFVMKVRKEAADANILVVNHHLLFADIESRLEGVGFEDTAVLPPYRHVVFDEAHGIESAATSFFSSQVNRFRISKQLNLLYRIRRSAATGFVFTLLALCREAPSSELFVQNILDIKDSLTYLENTALDVLEYKYSLRLYGQTTGAFKNILEAMDVLRKKIIELTGNLRKLFDNMGDDVADQPVLYESRSVLRRLEDCASMLTNFVSWEEHPDSVFWIQKSKLAGSGAKNIENPFYVQFYQTPLDIAPMMNKGVFEPLQSVICTSATIGTGGNFNFWKKRTGVAFAENERVSEGNFPSSFPYKTNVLFAVTRDAPLPDKNAEFQMYAEEAVVKLIRAASGRTLVLFTSYDSLRHACDSARTALRTSGINILKQGDDDRFRLLSTFKDDNQSVLFATDSFWEGVDVPGSSLSQVIIVKLPFIVPDDPVYAARSDIIQQRGGNPFMELSVPDAIIKFRQGFGRLMRRSDDKGVIVVLDRRLAERQYGRMFSASVPQTKKMYDGVDAIADAVERFLE